MAVTSYLIKPRPPVRAFVIAAVGALLGAVLIVASLSNNWHWLVAVLGAVLLLGSVALVVAAWLSIDRLAVSIALDDEGYRAQGRGVNHQGQWHDVTKVTQSEEGSHVTIYHGSVRRTHLLFPGGDRRQIDDVLNEVQTRLRAVKGGR